MTDIQATGPQPLGDVSHPSEHPEGIDTPKDGSGNHLSDPIERSTSTGESLDKSDHASARARFIPKGRVGGGMKGATTGGSGGTGKGK